MFHFLGYVFHALAALLFTPMFGVRLFTCCFHCVLCSYSDQQLQFWNDLGVEKLPDAATSIWETLSQNIRGLSVK
jgi:hypothetical protein